MRDTTRLTISQLEAATWFENVGKRDTERTIVLGSWKEAIASCSSREWESVTLEAANSHAERVLEVSRERFAQWNEHVDAIRPIFVSLVSRKIESAIAHNNLPDVFRQCVEWDMIQLGMECEYADVVPPRFFAAGGYWYTHGHFPCGWRGPIRGGQIVIY